MTTNTNKRYGFVLICLCSVLTACGGGGSGDSSAGNTPGSGSELSNFAVVYTHASYLDGSSITSHMNFFFDWFVENADGSVRGPFESNNSGQVDLGQESRASANVTRKLLPGFYYTYMEVPVGHRSYDNSSNLPAVQESVTVRNMSASGQVRLGTDLRGWFTVTGDPYTLPSQSVFPYTVMDSDNAASMFVSYRAAIAEEPLSRYAFLLDFPVSNLSNLSVDLGGMHTRVARNWQAPRQTLTDAPCVVAQRKGQLFIDIGGAGGTGAAGSVGIPDQFPADRWYLADDCVSTKVIASFDPAAATAVELRHFDRSIVNDSFIIDTAGRTASFVLAAAGTDPIHYGHVELHQGGSLSWVIFFPWSAVTTAVDGTGTTTATLQLPALPGHSTLPVFDFVHASLYRLDGGLSADAYLHYLLNGKANPYPSYATISEFQ